MPSSSSNPFVVHRGSESPSGVVHNAPYLKDVTVSRALAEDELREAVIKVVVDMNSLEQAGKVCRRGRRTFGFFF